MPSLPRSHNIVGRWVPSAGATGFRLVDRSGRSNHGTLTNMDPASDYVASGGKLALDLDGSNDFVSTRAIPLGTIHTSSAWLFAGSAPAFSFQGFNGQGLGDTNFCSIAFSATGTASTLTTFVYSFSSTGVSVSIPNVFQKWTHAVTVRIGTSVEFYLNGVSVGSGSNVGLSGSFSPDRFGQRSAGVNFQGLLDDYMLYNTALTANEVAQVYRLGRGYGVFPEPDFDEGFAAAGFKAYWARRQSQLIGGGV
jgi:hypothetical protein